MCGQNSNSHLNSVVKPVCLPIFCCRIFILFAIWDPKSWFKAVCDQKNFILCWYRTRITLNNRVMWTVSDLSLPVSIASRFPPGPLEAEWPIPSLHPSIHPYIHPFLHASLHLPSINSSLYPYILIHAWMHAPTLCIGVPAFHYVMGGGWELCTQSVIVKRIRCDRHRDEPTSDLTLN